MNILLYTEVAPRELDSKLLIAVVAASRGHTAVVSDKRTLFFAIKSNLFRGAIFHTKSVTPDSRKIREHRAILDKGLFVTSQDEEAGLQNHGFESFAKMRFAAESIGQLSALFCWGPEDFETLVGLYPQYRNRIHLVGSPRADMWGRPFARAATTPGRFGLEGYLLVSSNFGIGFKPIEDVFREYFDSGYVARNPMALEERFAIFRDKFKLSWKFIEALRDLSRRLPALQIVFRPHPTERISLWQMFLQDLPNVHVIREGASSDWIHHSKALVHNGCTTAFEAFLAGKPVISFEPFERDYGSVANQLGVRTRTVEELATTLQNLEDGGGLTSPVARETAETLVKRKIFTSEESLAAERIVDVWEGVAGQHGNRAFPFRRFRWLTARNRWRNNLRRLLRRAPKQKKDEKFPPQDFEMIVEKVRAIETVLGLEKGVTVRSMHDRCFVVSPRK